MSEPTEPPAGEALSVPWDDIGRFARQLSHDLRNHLNAAQLQSAYVAEVTEDPELKEELKRLREMLGDMGASLQQLTDSLAPIRLTLMPYEASHFIEDLSSRVSTRFADESSAIEWTVDTGGALLKIDPQILQMAFLELFANAFQHERGSGPLRARAKVHGSEFVFTLTEPKTNFAGEMAQWGRRPFARMTRGHYGLGLPQVRSIIAAHHGRLDAKFDSSSSALVTEIALPLGRAA